MQRRFIINADETILRSEYNSRCTLRKINSDSVVTGTPNNNKTLAVLPSITLTGKRLRTYVIIPGKTKRSLHKFHHDNHFPSRHYSHRTVLFELSGNRKSWFNIKHMHTYIHQIILPYTQYQPSILLLDSATHHHNSDFISTVQYTTLQ